MERFINVLVIDNDVKNRNGLKEILGGSGNNLLFVNSIDESYPILQKKEIGILLINIDDISFKGFELFKTIKDHSYSKSIYIIAITSNAYTGIKMVKGMNEGAIDYITKPFNPNLILAKIEVYKTLFHKDQRINQLLNNIFPEKVLEDLNNNGKFSPKRVENGVVLFTDFIKFSQKASKIKPLQLLKKLEHYFTQFDEIIGRYKLEKIKTIGDSYMVIGGVTEDNQQPAIRACLAALEIRNFMLNEKSIAEAMNQDFWEIRIGIHMGPLVAGIIGSKKYSFDVWGDSVNIASRAEQSANENSIVITEKIQADIKEYFEVTNLGKLEIKTRGGKIEMFTLNKLKNEYSLYKEGKIANGQIRTLCELSNVDFDHMRKDLLNKLKSSLPEEVVYHDLAHTLNVEKSALRLAKLEGLNEEETMLLQTAVLYHDAGYIVSNVDNEKFAINLAKVNLAKFGYTDFQIDEIIKIIDATKQISDTTPDLLSQIMCDADHDYFGRADYYAVSKKLREENENYGKIMTEKEWILYQLNYLENIHEYKTETAKNIRQFGKNIRINELKNALKTIDNK
jgi:adenylate cyclase